VLPPSLKSSLIEAFKESFVSLCTKVQHIGGPADIRTLVADNHGMLLFFTQRTLRTPSIRIWFDCLGFPFLPITLGVLRVLCVKNNPVLRSSGLSAGIAATWPLLTLSRQGVPRVSTCNFGPVPPGSTRRAFTACVGVSKFEWWAVPTLLGFVTHLIFACVGGCVFGRRLPVFPVGAGRFAPFSPRFGRDQLPFIRRG